MSAAGPAYDAADISAVLFVSVGVMLALVLAYLVTRWALGGSDAYEETSR